MPIVNNFDLPPQGDIGKEPFPVEQTDTGMRSQGYALDAGAHFDWFNDRLQILVDDGTVGEPALYVRYNADGSIAQILVRSDLMPLVEDEEGANSKWQDERDSH